MHSKKYQETVTFGEIAPQYENIRFARNQGHGQLVATSRPLWNPRYWSRKIWIAIVVVVAIIVAIIIAVAVTVTKKNAYPDYSALKYDLRDTSHGLVHYVPRADAVNRNLTYATQNSAFLRVDTAVGPDSNPNASTGRFSVRLESKKTYNSGLFIFDIKHTPYACGAWPALWLTDPSNWPDHGEIDIMEAINQGAAGNTMTLHTTGDCSMGVRRKQTGETDQENCDHGVNSNAGCAVRESPSTFGPKLNDAGGSVMAVEWRRAGIRMWQFARSAVPSDIAGKQPNPTTWGTAAADFPSTACDIGSRFKNNSIIVNIDLCGDLVYGSWDKSGCPGTCQDVVANQPDSFKTAFWEFGSFEVYQST
ncbi:Concanavalin A-like lectin/glucanase [Metarhizium album ARSEF 1941]|uniref:Concanavalin A-like lectin/glucanase n=1 Tax=Metarhizium album (strain ARSEF 1941) TaxID=1081103 RepID=A0A0B2X4W5_METAS|nr:Concanavalin A-like lectin/glucanase [Metarhizium album ARSEF 1941]KHO01414.1 Concanavalin A-like lectin/glucanase [Metarhizium album ARSEF 1941]